MFTILTGIAFRLTAIVLQIHRLFALLFDKSKIFFQNMYSRSSPSFSGGDFEHLQQKRSQVVQEYRDTEKLRVTSDLSSILSQEHGTAGSRPSGTSAGSERCEEGREGKDRPGKEDCFRAPRRDDPRGVGTETHSQTVKFAEASV